MATSADQAFCPYKGLQPYTEADHKYFFGRTRDIGIIISNLYAASVTVFYGASGVGKSSVLLAGVVPKLRNEPRDVAVVVFSGWQGDFLAALKNEVVKQAGIDTPIDTAQPLDDFLAQTQRALGLPLFLVFDQFEEYFLYNPSSIQGEAFESSFARAVNRRSIQVNFLLLMREDGLSKLDRFQGRVPSLLNNMLRLGHLDRDSAKEAITLPLDQYNLELAPGQLPMKIEESLIEAVLSDLSTVRTSSDRVGQGRVDEKTQSAAAPIEAPFLQVVLTRLWQEEAKQHSGVLRLQTFDALGRAAKIAETHLDTMMARLTQAERQTAANIMRFLVTPAGTKIAQEAGALASWSELPAGEIQTVLDRLSKSDMSILRTVEAPGQPMRYQIFHDVLANAILDWRARFVQEEQLSHQRKRARRLRLIAAGLSLMLLIMIVLAGMVFRANGRVHSGELAASSRAQLEIDPELSLLLAMEAVKTRDTPKARAALKDALIASQVKAVLNAKTGTRVADAGFSLDGKYIVTANWDGRARVWETEGGKLVSVLAGHGEQVSSASFSSDGKYVVTASQDNMARVWDGWQVGTPRIVTMLSDNYIASAAFSPDGNYLMTADGEGKVRVWDWRVDSPTEQAKLDIAVALSSPSPSVESTAPPAGGVNVPAITTSSPAPSPGATPASSPVASPKPGKLPIYKAAFSPDGNYIIVAAKTRNVLVWHWKEEKNNDVKIILTGHVSGVYDAAFNGDGAYAVTGSDDSTAIVWDLKKKKDLAIVRFSLGTNRIRGVAFSHDSKYVATASYDRLARLYEWRMFEQTVSAAQKPEQRAQPNILSGHTGLVICVAFSPDGQYVITGSDDGTARVWRIQKLERSYLDTLSSDQLMELAKTRVTRELTPEEKDL